ncbi:hypothetical protein AYI70_g3193 [Smittium culicis]|uniref:Uncharacterized protein n=1 Tax=Smittium culicis TaxID=133412 RepID=A0A1R1XI87_9FUNG|nr:hypothetical protein AYI70_g7935 [Smittium culicis]OMJ21900.1 hypothetical protein AYI70_g3193 [Smittium culicis]
MSNFGYSSFSSRETFFDSPFPNNRKVDQFFDNFSSHKVTASCCLCAGDCTHFNSPKFGGSLYGSSFFEVHTGGKFGSFGCDGTNTRERTKCCGGCYTAVTRRCGCACNCKAKKIEHKSSDCTIYESLESEKTSDQNEIKADIKISVTDKTTTEQSSGHTHSEKIHKTTNQTSNSGNAIDIDIKADHIKQSDKNSSAQDISGLISIHPNSKNQQPIQATKCTICKFFCLGICSIPYNPNARFKCKNFRLYPDYDFLPDSAKVPKESGASLPSKVSKKDSRMKITIFNLRSNVENLTVDIIGDDTIVTGNLINPVRLSKPGFFSGLTSKFSSNGQTQTTKTSKLSRNSVLDSSDNKYDRTPALNKPSDSKFVMVFRTNNFAYELERAHASIDIDGHLVLIFPTRKGGK